MSASAENTPPLEELEAGLDRIMASPNPREDVPVKDYMRLYTLIHNYCTAQKSSGTQKSKPGERGRGAHLLGEELYYWLSDYLKRYLQKVQTELASQPREALVASYTEQWKIFEDHAKYTAHLFRFLDRHWVAREKDEGRQDVYNTYELHHKLWRDVVLESEHEGATLKAVLRDDIEKAKKEDGESKSMKDLLESFAALGVDEGDWVLVEDQQATNE